MIKDYTFILQYLETLTASTADYVLINTGGNNKKISLANFISSLGLGSGGGGITSLNTLTGATQTFATGTSGSDFGISSSGTSHTFNLPTASSSIRGLLSSTDWSAFNSKEPALTKGNLTETTSSVLTISGGSNAVIGSGTSIQVKQASSSQSGYLSSTDWTNFNNKGSGTITSVAGSNPIASTGGTTPTISISDAIADGSTKGAAAFNASDFNSTSGVISLDYTNGQAASVSNKGFLTSTDWSTFNGKQDAITLTTTGTSGAATLIGNTLNIPQYSGGSGSTDSINWTHTESLSSIGSAIKAEPLYGTLSTITASGINPFSQRIYLVSVWLSKAATITGVKWMQSTIGNYTASNFNGVGLYTLSAGTFTRVAVSANDGTLLAQAGLNALKSKAFTSTYSASAGLYYAALLYSASATVTNPVIQILPNAIYNSYTLDNTNSVYLSMYANSQTSMPTTLSIPGYYLQSNIPYLALY